jgi:cell division protein FtsZ
LHEIHEASSIIQKAAHEDANIIFGAVLDETMKESVKITVIAAGFRDAARRVVQQPRSSYLPKTWKAGREDAAPEPVAQVAPPPPARQAPEIIHEVQTDDLEVPTFLRRKAQSA